MCRLTSSVFSLWVTLALAAVVVTAQQTRLCGQHAGSSITKDVIAFNTLKLNLNDVHYTWQATRGTRNLTVEHSQDVSIKIKESGKTLKIVANTDTTSKSSCLTLVSPLVWGLGLIGLIFNHSHKTWIVLLLAASMVFFCQGTETECLNQASIHILIPSEMIEEICEGSTCHPVLCKLSPFSEYSNVPSNTKILFEDNFCTVKEPARWNEWLEHYFGPNSTQDYYGDFDGDGLVNVLEYYGQSVFEDAFVIFLDVPNDNETDSNNTTAGSSRRRRRQLIPIEELGTSPLDADSDGDLLQDGFEVFNKLDPLVFDDITEDYDNDLLDNLNEQIMNTDPRNPDSDGDGVPDGTEVNEGGNPKNPADKGQQPPSKQTAMVKLTVGDHSGSHSERYVLHVGQVSHQSPGYGLVGSGTYTFKSGSYPITLQHAGTNLGSPDFDYTALVEKVGGEAKVSVNDPHGMMGLHGESNPFYAAGKQATLVVEDECPEDTTEEECECAKLKTCTECKANDKCQWDIDGKTCDKESWGWGTVSGQEKCPCEKCKEWYDSEEDDTDWLDDLNREFPCPCTVSINVFSVTPTDQPDGNWKADDACMAHGYPLCSKFHPGASGCLRSATNAPSGARQQCCYGDNGALLPPGHSGAGTPDRAGSFWDHQEVDVKTFKWCCKECEIDTYCQYYMNLRKGSDKHCN